MGLKERVEASQKTRQQEILNEARRAQEREKLHTGKSFQVVQRSERWRQAEQQYNEALLEEQKNVAYIRQVANLAMQQIEPTLQVLKKRVTGKCPYVDMVVGLDIHAALTVRSDKDEVIRRIISGAGWKDSVKAGLLAHLNWGRYPLQTYYRGFIDRERWVRSDYSAIDIHAVFVDETDSLSTFGDFSINNEYVPFLDWQKRPQTLADLIIKGFSNPIVFRIDKPEPPMGPQVSYSTP